MSKVQPLQLPLAEPLWEVFHRLIETHPAAMAITRVEQHGRRIVYANPAFYRLRGCAAAEVLGRDWNYIRQSEDGASRAERALVIADQDEASEVLVETRDVRGSVRWLSVRSWALPGRAGAATHHVMVLQDVTAERIAREELQRRACYDALTGLANRHLFHDRFGAAMAHMRRYGGSLALAVLDMDGFKAINDRFGHAGGDQVLKCVGARMAAAVRADDTVARLGGDEFVLLLLDAHPRSSLRQVIERVLEAVERPILLGETRLSVSCRVGLARYPRDGRGVEALLEAADAALYRAKAVLKRGLGDAAGQRTQFA